MISTGGEGKVPPRKRMRGKIGNPSAAPELKTHNLLRNDVDTPQTFYDQTQVKGVYTGAPSGVWYPAVMNWPTVGTSAHQRIGNKIRVKLLRIKGFVGYSPYLITQVRYRIVLYRTKNFQLFNHGNFIAPMYSAFINIHNAGDSDAKQRACATDYYMSFFNKDYMQQNEIKRRVLFRGMIKPQPDVPNFQFENKQWTGLIAPGEAPTVISTATTGKHFGKIWQQVNQGTLYQSTSYFNGDEVATAPLNVALESSTGLQNLTYTLNQPFEVGVGLFQIHYPIAGQSAAYVNSAPGNQRGFFPIDITVNMNDNIDCEKYKYVIVIEADWCIGQDVTGQFGYSEDKSNFFISYIPHIYYTDD